MTLGTSRAALGSPLGVLAKLGLAAEILVIYVRARLVMRRGEVPRALGALRAEAPPPIPAVDGADQLAAERLTRAVLRTLGPLPTDSRCLVRSIVLISLMARRALPGRLVIGVRPGSGHTADGFGAHAWVELDGHRLLPAGNYERLVEL